MGVYSDRKQSEDVEGFLEDTADKIMNLQEADFNSIVQGASNKSS